MFKNALLYITRKKLKTLILFDIFFVQLHSSYLQKIHLKI